MNRIVAALLLLPGLACAQTRPNIQESGRSTGQLPPAGRPVILKQDLEAEFARKADVAALAGKADAAALNALNTFVQAVNGVLVAQGNAATALAATVATKADGAFVNAMNAILVGKLDASAFRTTSVTWSVCASGCNYTHPTPAWAAARSYVAFGPFAYITINVAPGTYTVTEPFVTEEPGTANIHFVGNPANPSSVRFQFTNIAGNNGMAFMAMNGGRIGNAGVPGVTGVWLQGIGAQISRSAWTAQSFGAGAFASGSGSNIHMGAVRISNFYYSVLADEGGHYTGDPGSFYQSAGDVNVLARHGSVVHCLGCVAQSASDIRGAEGTFGFNFLAESASAVYVDGSTGTDAQVACFAAQTAASMWAHDTEGSNCGASGARATQGAFLELTRARLHGSPSGVVVLSNGSVSVDGTELYGNQFNGLWVVGGQAYGNALRSHNNGSFGIKAEKGARTELYDALAGSTGNGDGAIYNETGVPCQVLNGPCNPPSLMIIN